MLNLQTYAAAIAADRRTLTHRAIEALNEHVLMHLANPEAVIEELIERVLEALVRNETGGLAEWARTEGRRHADRYLSEMVAAATFAVCAAAELVPTDRRELLTFCDRLKSEVAEVVAVNAALTDENESSDAFVAVMAALNARDIGTCSHSRATGSWARRLATAMGLPKAQIETIEFAAMLHDVGKMSTPDSILLKPGPLTEAEWVVMRRHAEDGEKILSRIPSLARYARIVRAHHERYDGTGYPDGLRGSEIPFEARVISVVDAFHAMTSNRPYRTPLAPRAAMQRLREGSGTQWDPKVVNSMIGFLENSPAVESRRVAHG